MRNIYIVLLAAVFMLTGCEKQSQLVKGESFRVEFVDFVDPTGAKLTIQDQNYQYLLFDEGDIIYVNNVPFQLGKDGNNRWVANRVSGSGPVEGDAFYCLYVDPNHCQKLAWHEANKTYEVQFAEETDYIGPDDDFDVCATGIVLESMTTDTVITMRPTCAILRFESKKLVRGEYEVFFGFGDDVAVYSGVVHPAVPTSNPSFTNVDYLDGIEYYQYVSGNWYTSGSVIKAVTENMRPGIQEKFKYHVTLPLVGETQTDAYILLRRTSDDYYYYYKLENQTYKPGYVYYYKW